MGITGSERVCTLHLFHSSGDQALYVRIALAFGLAVATIAQACTRTLPCDQIVSIGPTSRPWDTSLAVTSTLLLQLALWLEPRSVFALNLSFRLTIPTISIFHYLKGGST